MLYLTIETLGPIAEAHAIAFSHHTGNALADVTAVLLRARTQRPALLTAIGATPDYHRFQLFGDKAWAELRDDRHFVFQPLGGPRETLELGAIDAERAEIEAFGAALAGEAEFPVPLSLAVHSVFALEAIARSAAEGGLAQVG
jgi:hypothetical protein